MKSRHTNRKGLARPTLSREDLFVRACEAFVDGLPIMLRIGLVIGGIYLMGQVDRLIPDPAATGFVAETAPLLAPEASDHAQAQPSILQKESDARVKHFRLCGYKEYRDANYDECVADTSIVYPGQPAGDDDRGLVISDPPSRFARLEASGATGPASPPDL